MHVIEKLNYATFDWDPVKQRRTLAERGLDFADAARSLMAPHLEIRSDRNGEIRILATCLHSMQIIAVVYTPRGDVCRIISVRRARKNEQAEYRQLLGG